MKPTKTFDTPPFLVFNLIYAIKTRASTLSYGTGASLVEKPCLNLCKIEK